MTERTRAIGLRLAVGTGDSDVLTRFLIEAIVRSRAGGAIGVLLQLERAGGRRLLRIAYRLREE